MTRIFSIIATCVSLALAGANLTACSSTNTSAMQPIPAVPAPVTGAPAASLAPYKVQVGDVLDVKLFQNPELNDEVTVRPDGMISTAIAQDVPAYNRTPSEISAALRQQYQSDLK